MQYLAVSDSHVFVSKRMNLLQMFNMFFKAISISLVDINKTSCTSQEYSGTVCLTELQQWYYCGGGSGSVPIPSEIDQEAQEREAQQVLTSLQFLNPSTECVRSFRPFFCLFFFGVCDDRGHVAQPSYQDCVALRSDICVEEIQTAIGLLGTDPFPPCDKVSHNMTLCCKFNESLIYTSISDLLLCLIYTFLPNLSP